MESTLPEDLKADVLDVQRVKAVSSILEVVCPVTGIGFAAVARVTEDRWIACAVKDDIAFGLKPGGELKVETTICNEIRQSGREVVIDHVAEDPNFCRHPTPAMYGFQSYISVPIVRSNGAFFGTLCAIDPRPIKLRTPEVVGMFKLFADLISMHLDALDRLTDAGRQASLREQFIAILGHDLRNPLASVKAGAELLEKRIAGKAEVEILRRMKSSADRMYGLINDMLDLARSRSAEGFGLSRSEVDLEPVLSQVVDEARATAGDQRITCTFDLRQPVWCDPARLSQLLSNLLANAVSHGASDRPVEVKARTDERGLELAVVNFGATIPTDTQERLFQPFFRSSIRSGGLGLGLYIASEIARAHGGNLQVTSADNRTTFTLLLPRLSASAADHNRACRADDPRPRIGEPRRPSGRNIPWWTGLTLKFRRKLGGSWPNEPSAWHGASQTGLTETGFLNTRMSSPTRWQSWRLLLTSATKRSSGSLGATPSARCRFC